ncbi:MAG TPA: glycosyltransferase [Chloroflexia bacterium]|nr:glycosyltransferase [Chloroflexia bacterium]
MITRIKVVHLITGLGVGGAEMMLYKLVTHQNSQPLENIVVSLTEGGFFREKVEASGVKVYSLGMQPGRPSLAAILKLIKILKKVQPDIVQSWLYHADLLGTLATRLTGNVPLVWGVHNSYLDMSKYRRLSGWTLKACARLSNLPTAVLAVSEAGRDYHSSIGYKPREWALIPNGIDTEQFKPDRQARSEVRKELNLSEETPLIGLIARFDPQKDHANFFRAAAILNELRPDVHFVLAGKDVTRENQQLASLIKLKDPSVVHLLGLRQDIPRLTAAFDISTSSSFGEAFPLVLGEAMACAVPLVVTDVGDSAKVVGDTGRVVPPRNAPALATAWKELLEVPLEERLALGNRSRQRVQDFYSLDMVVSEYAALYERLLMVSSIRTNRKVSLSGSLNEGFR